MPVHSVGEASGTVAPDFGGWLPLGARENALEDRGHLFEPQASCAPCSPPLAFFRKLRGTAWEIPGVWDWRQTGSVLSPKSSLPSQKQRTALRLPFIHFHIQFHSRKYRP